MATDRARNRFAAKALSRADRSRKALGEIQSPKVLRQRLGWRPPEIGSDHGPMSRAGVDAEDACRRGRPMQKRAAYRELAKFNRRIAEAT